MAMEYIRGEGEYAASERPELVILDLNLPRKSGSEVLAELKGDPELAAIPVVVLTTSQTEEDVVRAYQQHANAFITKPLDFERFKQIVQQIDDFFIGLVRLPGPPVRGGLSARSAGALARALRGAARTGGREADRRAHLATSSSSSRRCLSASSRSCVSAIRNASLAAARPLRTALRSACIGGLDAPLHVGPVAAGQRRDAAPHHVHAHVAARRRRDR